MCFPVIYSSFLHFMPSFGVPRFFFHEASFRTSFSKSLDSAINVLHTFFIERLYFSFQLEAGWWEADVLTQGPGGVTSLPDSLSLMCVDKKPLPVHQSFSDNASSFGSGRLHAFSLCLLVLAVSLT